MDLTSHVIALLVSITNAVYSVVEYNSYEIYIFASMSMIYALPTYCIWRYNNTYDGYKPCVFLATTCVLAIDTYYNSYNVFKNVCMLGIMILNNAYEHIPEITWLSLYCISMIVGSMHSNTRLNMANHAWFISFMTMYGGTDIRMNYNLAIREHSYKHVAFGISNILHIFLVYVRIPEPYELSIIAALSLIFGSSVYFHYNDRVQDHTNEIFANIIQILCYMQLDEVWNDPLILILVSEVVMNSILVGLGMNRKKTDELNVIVNKNGISKYMIPIFGNLILTVIGVRYQFHVLVFVFSWLAIFVYIVVNNIKFY